MFRALFALLALTGSATTWADGYLPSGHIAYLRIDADGRGMIIFDQNIGGTQPACVHTSFRNAFAFDTNTAAGRAIYALALSAKATDAPLLVHGTNTCAVYGGAWVEDWSYGEEH